MAATLRKGQRVRIIGGRWKDRPALIVGRSICGAYSLSLLDSDWDSPIVATQAENLEPEREETPPEVRVKGDRAEIWL